MKSKYARTIHPFRTSGVNLPGYSRPPQQQPVQQHPPASPVPQARPTAPRRPQDARTMQEALAGLQQAAQQRVQLVAPRFRSTAGPWIRMGEFDLRIPPDVMIRIHRARSGDHIAVIAYLDSSREAGRTQVLITRAEGVRELIGLMPEQLRQLREVFLGR